MMKDIKNKYQGESLISRRVFDIKRSRAARFAPLLLALLFPLFAFAAAPTFKSLVIKITTLFQAIIPTLIGLGVFLLAYGIFRYISAGGDEKKMIEARQLILWGVIALFIMVSFYGLVQLLIATVFDTGAEGTGGFTISNLLFPQ